MARDDPDVVSRTYLLHREVAQEIRQISADLQAYDSSLVNLLLERGLADLRDKQLRLRRRPVKWILELEE